MRILRYSDEENKPNLRIIPQYYSGEIIFIYTVIARFKKHSYKTLIMRNILHYV
jgi:hypothetical protein